MKKVSPCLAVFILSMFLMTSLMLSVGCHTKALNYSPQSIAVIKPVKNGTSIVDAIIVEEKTANAGIHFEHLWTKEKYPGYTWDRQVLHPLRGRYYDIITLQKNKDVKTVYFDITSFYSRK